MLSQLKRFTGDSFVYTLMNVGTKVVNFILVLTFTHLLTKNEIGVIGAIDSFISICSALVIFGTDSALAYYYFAKKDSKEERLKYVQNVMGFRLCIALFFILIATFASSYLSSLLTSAGDQFKVAIQISLWTLLLDTIVILVITLYRYDFKTIRVVLLTLTKLILVVILSYVFLNIHATVENVMYARLISVFIVLLLCGKQVFRFLTLKFDKEKLKELLSYAAPLVPASLAVWIMGSSNRLFIIHLLPDGQAAAGIFDIAFRFATMITFLTYGIQMAWRPFSMQLKDSENSKELFAKVYSIIFVMGMLGLLFLTTIMPWVIKATGKDFWSSYQYVGFLALGSFLNFYYLIISVGLFFEKKTMVITKAFGISAILSFLLNLTLIPLFELWGCVTANIISYLVALIVIFIKSQKVYYVPFPKYKISFLFIQSVISMGTMVFLQVKNYPLIFQVIPWLYIALSLFFSKIVKDFSFKRT